MSTILDALRRLQADREEERVPSRDLRETLTEPLAVSRRGRPLARSARVGAFSVIGGVCIGAVLGVWTFSGAMFSAADSDKSVAAPGGEASPAGPRGPEPERLQLPVPAAQDSRDTPAVAENYPPIPTQNIGDYEDRDAATGVEPRVSSSAPAEVRYPPAQPAEPLAQPDEPLEVVDTPPPATRRPVRQVRAAPPSSRPARVEPAPAPARGYSAISQNRRPEPAVQPPAPPSAAPAPRTPVRQVRAPDPPRGSQKTPPRRAVPPAPLPPAPEVPPPDSVVDAVPFPNLAVSSVRWHPDPKRREASVEVDGAVAVSAREGELVGGALLARIAPGEVEFRVGVRSKVVRVGR